MDAVLLIGASVRAAAFSAVRAGLRPLAIDLFADRDLTAMCPTRNLPAGTYPDGVIALAKQAPPGPWMYTGALENRPDVVEQVSRDRPLWGNDAACLGRARDPFALADSLRAADVPHLAVRRIEESPAGRWLVKPFASAGGAGIRFATRSNRSKRATYLQEFVSGESRSGVFVANAAGCHLLGVTRQLIGVSWLHARPFRYSGSVGTLALSPAEDTAWKRLGRVIANVTGVRGLFGVDAVMRDGVPWPVEVNPRYTASVEVLELATDISALTLHREAFDTAGVDASARRVSDRPTTASRRDVRPSVVGKVVWYAPRMLIFPADGPWEAVLGRRPAIDVPPAFADIPSAGQRIAAGRPVLTALATAATIDDCELRLRSIAAELDAFLLR
jgi:predicted ATP-grasp superfamily ATP-dependent carboligase